MEAGESRENVIMGFIMGMSDYVIIVILSTAKNLEWLKIQILRICSDTIESQHIFLQKMTTCSILNILNILLLEIYEDF